MPAADAPAQAPVAHLLGWDCVEFWVGNARAFAGFLMAGVRLPLHRLRRPRDRGARQGQLRARAGRHPLRRDAARSPPTRPSPSTSAPTATACTTWPGSSTTPTRPSTPRSPAVPGRPRAPWSETDEHGTLAPRPDRHLRRDRAHLRRAASATRRRCSSPATTDENLPPDPGRSRRSACSRIDHVVGNVEQGKLDDWVRFYARRARLRPARALRRRPDRHRVLGADVDRRVGRHQDRDADQRAGRRAQEEPDPGVPRDLRRPRRAAHRPAHRRHRRHRRRAAGARRALHARARHLLRRGPGQRLARRRPAVGRPAAPTTSSSTATQDGHLLQIFTETVTDRPTVFFEIIERAGRPRLRRGQLQGAVRGHRARPGPPRQPVRA